MGKANYRKITANTENYVKNPKRKKTRGERDFTIIMVITMMVLWCARISGLNSSSFHIGKDFLFIQVVPVG